MASKRGTTVDDRELAQLIGERIRQARLDAGLTQQQLAGARYTKAYISALEHGHARPSMVALNFISDRLGLSAAHFMAAQPQSRARLEADLLLASGQWQEALDRYEELASGQEDRTARAEGLRGQAEALCRLGRGLAAIRPATEAYEIFQTLGRGPDAILAGYWLANAHYLAENMAEARSILRMVLDQARSVGQVEPDLYLRLLTGASYIETWDGKHEAAIAYLEEARGISADMDDRRRAAFLSALAMAYYDTGDLEGAIRAGNQSLALFRAAEATHEAALIENNLANAFLALGNLGRASELVEKAHREHDRSGDDRQLAAVLDTEARILLAKGDLDKARTLAEQAVQAAEATQNQKAATDARLTSARVNAQAGMVADAVALFEQVAADLRANGPRTRLAEVLGEWAELVAAEGDHARAYELTREALNSRSAIAGS